MEQEKDILHYVLVQSIDKIIKGRINRLHENLAVKRIVESTWNCFYFDFP